MFNSYRAIQALLSDGAVQVGEVQQSASGELVVVLDSGAKLAAKGSEPVGQRVCIKNGYVQGKAPNMTSQTIEV